METHHSDSASPYSDSSGNGSAYKLSVFPSPLCIDSYATSLWASTQGGLKKMPLQVFGALFCVVSSFLDCPATASPLCLPKLQFPFLQLSKAAEFCLASLSVSSAQKLPSGRKSGILELTSFVFLFSRTMVLC